MALNKQVHLYGIDTSYFYNTKELKIHKKLNSMYIQRSIWYKEIIDIEKLKKKEASQEKIEEATSNNSYWQDKISEVNKIIKKQKLKLINKLNNNNHKRKLNANMLKKSDIISSFDSAMTRTIGCRIGEITQDITIVQVFYFQVMESIMKKGFTWGGEDYIGYTASAGQIRLKKFVAIKKSVFKKHQMTLTCGLTDEIINNNGGVNTNKYLAYLALNNSATEVWEGFDIDKSIVVDDFETNVNGNVDFIDYETYKISENVSMDIPIPHTDGAGMCLPKVSKKSMMVRLPWQKGLMIPFPFDKFIREKIKQFPNASKVKDIYGKEYDIFKDDIQVIFTKSQFKMHAFYDSWDDYKNKYKKYNCQAGYCNEEKNNPSFSRINYQMLQTLIDITDDEILKITNKTSDKVKNIGSNKGVMLKVLGADKNKLNKNYYQQALGLYPELLRDKHSKEILKDVKKSLVKDAKGGKLFIDASYTFICPDLYGFSEWLFLGIENPKGLLEDGQVSCSLYKKSNKVDILRSPHLYREHGIRENIWNSKISKWFCTSGVYVSSHDLISKLLQFDVDGDQALVVKDETVISVAERNMKNIIPIYYNMKKAPSQQLNSDSIYDGLSNAYRNTTIGLYSNSITKVWNNDNPNLDVIKLLCLESNFSIDSAKTLFFIKRPKNEDNLISRYTKTKVPHFFVHAKNKLEGNVEPLSDVTTMGRIESAIPNSRLIFKKNGLEKLDYTMLMKNKGIKLDDSITEVYAKLNIKIGHHAKRKDTDEGSHMDYLYFKLREELLSMREDKNEVVDIIVAYVFGKDSKHKNTIWSSFGDIIVDNLKENMKIKGLDKTISCDVCGKRVDKKTSNQLYCDDCKIEIQLKNMRKANRKTYLSKKLDKR